MFRQSFSVSLIPLSVEFIAQTWNTCEPHIYFQHSLRHVVFLHTSIILCVCACVQRFSLCTTMKTLLKTRSSGYLFSIHLFRCQALLIVGYWSQMLASNKCEKKTTSDKRKLTHRNARDIFICHNNIGAVRSSMFDIFHVRHSHVDRIQIQYCNMGISIVFWYIDSICENSSQCIKRPGNSFYSISKAYG